MRHYVFTVQTDNEISFEQAAQIREVLSNNIRLIAPESKTLGPIFTKKDEDSELELAIQTRIWEGPDGCIYVSTELGELKFDSLIDIQAKKWIKE